MLNSPGQKFFLLHSCLDIYSYCCSADILDIWRGGETRKPQTLQLIHPLYQLCERQPVFFPFSVCYFFITFLLLWELWSKTWAFSISIILRKFFFSVRFSFLFDSLFIFLQFIEKVSVFTWNLWGKILVFYEFPWSFQSFHQAKPAPGRHLPRVENFSLFSFNFEKIKRMFLRLASQKNSLQVNVLIKAFCRYFSSWRLPLHRHSYYERWQVHKFRKRTFFIFLLRWKISQIVFFCFHRKELCNMQKKRHRDL